MYQILALVTLTLVSSAPCPADTLAPAAAVTIEEMIASAEADWSARKDEVGLIGSAPLFGLSEPVGQTLSVARGAVSEADKGTRAAPRR